MRALTQASAGLGIVLCVATGSTGAWLTRHPEIKEIHLNIAVVCICVSTIAHILAIVSLRKKA
ncbi:hypothetical protein HY251_09585 [bacterium]|nr:hypothetical protein [bacterium]